MPEEKEMVVTTSTRKISSQKLRILMFKGNVIKHLADMLVLTYEESNLDAVINFMSKLAIDDHTEEVE